MNTPCEKTELLDYCEKLEIELRPQSEWIDIPVEDDIGYNPLKESIYMCRPTLTCSTSNFIVLKSEYYNEHSM